LFGNHAVSTFFEEDGHANTQMYDKEITESFVLHEPQIDAAILGLRNPWQTECEKQIEEIGSI